MTLTAAQIIRKAIATHGGNTWKHPKTLQLYGSTIIYSENGSKLILDTYNMQRVFPTTNTKARKAI